MKKGAPPQATHKMRVKPKHLPSLTSNQLSDATGPVRLATSDEGVCSADKTHRESIDAVDSFGDRSDYVPTTFQRGSNITFEAVQSNFDQQWRLH